MKQILKFEIELDENNLPLNIQMHASDGASKENEIKALMVSAWAAKTKETLRIDLWTKDMKVDEMKTFFHQTLTAMTDTFERATNETEMAKEMKEFGTKFAEKMDLIGPMN